MTTKEIRVRYAPSPTGLFHIGGARSALFNYLFAKKHGGKFIVRIEDTDLGRNVKDGEASQLENLRWLKIIPDETVDTADQTYGPYRQSERLDIYQKYINLLIKNNQAYYCFCSKAELDNSRQQQLAAGIKAPKYNQKCRKLTADEVKAKIDSGLKPAIRFKLQPNKEFIIEDLVRGTVKFNSNDFDDFIIFKANHYPTYNFAVVVDDHLMKISHVLRGEEHLSNTPKQLALYEAFNWSPPKFAHLPLILGPNHKKLSKRDSTLMQFLEQYRDQGYLPAAIVNFLALLGWSSGNEQEIFSLSELEKIFSLERVGKAPATFDSAKLKWLNNQYIKQLSLPDFYQLCLPFLKEAYNLKAVDQNWLNFLLSLFQPELDYGHQIISLVKPFFTKYSPLTEPLLSSLSTDDLPLITEFKTAIAKLDDWSEPQLKTIIKTLAKQYNRKGKALYMPLRIAATHSEHGPQLTAVLYLFGQDKVKSWLAETISALTSK